MIPRSTLEQWAVLAAVVDKGGFAQAATALHRSQSAVSYAVARLQQSLDVPVLAMQGRRAVLTPDGETLLQRARGVLNDIATLEQLARSLRQGWEPQLALVVDVAFPRERLLRILAELEQLCPNTQLHLEDAVLSGAEEAITEQRADVVVTTRVPPGFLGEFLLDIGFIAIASPGHPLFRLGRPLTTGDLARHTQVVVHDSGSRPRDEGWLGAKRRCTVSSMESSLAMIRSGLGFAWLPEHVIAAALREGAVRPLPLAAGGSRTVPLHLVMVHAEVAGPAARATAECFRRHVPITRAPEGPPPRAAADAGPA
ncbi:MAG TPA: LysR substrate-binding domain-containing protein [Steroidobacteraceae bacterium]|nr:LysR substrate-binding domain-containing protein [Steroidobacteraceae bacterium]